MRKFLLVVLCFFWTSSALANFYDPTLRPESLTGTKKTDSNTKISVNMIVLSPHNPKVLISGTWYKVGDQLGRYTVEAIKKDAVIFRVGKALYKQSLNLPVLKASQEQSNEPSRLNAVEPMNLSPQKD